MKTFSVLIGARAGHRRFSRHDDALVREITLRTFHAGFTILSARGAWYDPDRKKFLDQEARQIVICTEKAGQITAWCKTLGKALGQKELMVIALGSSRRVALP